MKGMEAMGVSMVQPAGERPATSFEAVEGGGETRNGTTLMVEAYAFIWLVLMLYIFNLWRKQRVLHTRLDELEAAMDRAEAAAKKT